MELQPGAGGSLTQIYEAHGPAGFSIPPGRQLLSLGIPVSLVNPPDLKNIIPAKMSKAFSLDNSGKNQEATSGLLHSESGLTMTVFFSILRLDWLRLDVSMWDPCAEVMESPDVVIFSGVTHRDSSTTSFLYSVPKRVPSLLRRSPPPVAC